MGASPQSQTPTAWSHRPNPAISYLGLRRGGYPGTGSSVRCCSLAALAAKSLL